MKTYIAIFLSISVVVLLYILYLAYFRSSINVLFDTPFNFLEDGGSKIIPSTKIPSFTSRNFAMSAWIYVKDWNTTQPKTIYAFTPENKTKITYNDTAGVSGSCGITNFSISWSSNIKCPSSINDQTMSLVLDTKSPNLYLNVSNGTYILPILLTNNFPLQKWTNVIVSFEGNTLDAYIDGKLVYSNSISYIDNTTGDKTTFNFKGNAGSRQILFGGDTNLPNISVTRCAFLPYTIDPQTALKIYSMGSGDNGSKYKVDLTFLKNNNVTRDIRIY